MSLSNPGDTSPELAGNSLQGIKVTFVLGAPGSGKGTLCKLLAAKTSAVHLSVGDYLRELSNEGSSENSKAALGGLDKDALRQTMTDRDLVPTGAIVAIIKYKMEILRAQGHEVILLDGFPRSVASAKHFEDVIGYPDRVLYFECPRDIAEKRFLDRQRSTDDNRQTYAKRYDLFKECSPELARRYANVLKVVDSSMEVTKGKESLFTALAIPLED